MTDIQPTTGAVILPPGYPESKVVLNGYLVRGLTAVKVSEFEYNLIVDSRFGHLVHVDDLEGYVYLIANAMAVSAGYTCHGENSKPANPFNTQVVEVGSIETNDDED